jgi:hypothetical protein
MKCWRRGGRFIISRHGPALTPTPPSQALLPRSLCPISSASSKHPRLFCRMSLPTAWQATVAAFARRPGSMLTGNLALWFGFICICFWFPILYHYQLCYVHLPTFCSFAPSDFFASCRSSQVASVDSYFSSHVYGPVLLGGWFSIDTDFPHNMHDYALGSLFC